MLAREIRNRHFKYLQMLQAILCHTAWTFRTDSVKLILGTLFDESEEVEDMKLKCCLVSLYNNQIINLGNRFRPEEAEMFISFWGEYTKVDRLLRLLARLERFYEGEKGLKGMFSLLTTLLGGPNLDYLTQMIDLVEEEYD